MSKIVSIEEHDNGKFIVYTRHYDDSIEPRVVDTEKEALQVASEILGKQEKQSNESTNN